MLPSRAKDGCLTGWKTRRYGAFLSYSLQLLASQQLAGAVEDVLGFGEADGVFSVIHSLVVFGYGI